MRKDVRNDIKIKVGKGWERDQTQAREVRMGRWWWY